MRQAVIYPGEDGFWVAECPSLPGCVSQGESREAAVVNIQEAIGGYILALQDDGLPVPGEQFEAGSGDYTAERWQWLPAETDVDCPTAAIGQETARHEQLES